MCQFVRAIFLCQWSPTWTEERSRAVAWRSHTPHHPSLNGAYKPVQLSHWHWESVKKKKKGPPPGKQFPPSACTDTRSVFIPPASLTDLAPHHPGSRWQASIANQMAYITSPSKVRIKGKWQRQKAGGLRELVPCDTLTCVSVFPWGLYITQKRELKVGFGKFVCLNKSDNLKWFNF